MDAKTLASHIGIALIRHTDEKKLLASRTSSTFDVFFTVDLSDECDSQVDAALTEHRNSQEAAGVRRPVSHRAGFSASLRLRDRNGARDNSRSSSGSNQRGESRTVM
jgi:hypothetical protein